MVVGSFNYGCGWCLSLIKFYNHDAKFSTEKYEIRALGGGLVTLPRCQNLILTSRIDKTIFPVSEPPDEARDRQTGRFRRQTVQFPVDGERSNSGR